MKAPRILLLVAALAAAALPLSARAADEGVRLRRFGLMIGVNDGGPGRPRLRYATSDARSVARVLESLGGLANDDLIVVDGGGRAGVDAAFDRVRALAASSPSGVRRELVVYYSGHSDEEGLLLGKERVSYDELRAHIGAVPAEVRVAILDSCASGAFTRHKGGVRRAPFLMDASADMRGHAFLTSSSATEVAQESDRIGASFFTHYFVSGLRGAADVDGDKRVTLQEAYAFASQETLARTERTRGGPQHAAYEFDLAGTGDLVVTDVRSTQASIVLGPDLGGRISVRGADGVLVAELRKAPGRTVELGLEAGHYRVAAEAGVGQFREADVALAPGQRVALAQPAFAQARPLEAAVARGAGEIPADELIQTKVDAQLIGTDQSRRSDVHGLAFGLVVSDVARVHGLQLALGVVQTNQELSGVQLAIGAAISRGTGRGLQLASGAAYSDGEFRGVQGASIATVARGQMRGLQMAGLANLGDGEVTGLQIAGAVNATRSMRGLQLAPVNVAATGGGMQLAAVNVAGQYDGFQLGVVNAATRMTGFQFGVVNVAREQQGESLGVLSFIGNGIHDVALYSTETTLTNLALKLGSRHLYTSLLAGFNPGDDATALEPGRIGRGTKRVGFGMGLGWRFRLDAGRLEFLELEASGMEMHKDFGDWDDAPVLSSLRLTAGIRLARYAALIAGAGMNVAVGWNGRDLDVGTGVLESVHRDGDTTVRLYPGLVLGLQI